MHYEELHNLGSLTRIIRVIKSRKMRSEEYVINMEQRRNICRIWIRKPEYNIILGLIFPRKIRMCGTVSSDSVTLW
jgi:hypothetical protein